MPVIYIDNNSEKYDDDENIKLESVLSELEILSFHNKNKTKSCLRDCDDIAMSSKLNVRSYFSQYVITFSLILSLLMLWV